MQESAWFSKTRANTTLQNTDLLFDSPTRTWHAKSHMLVLRVMFAFATPTPVSCQDMASKLVSPTTLPPTAPASCSLEDCWRSLNWTQSTPEPRKSMALNTTSRMSMVNQVPFKLSWMLVSREPPLVPRSSVLSREPLMVV